MIHYRIKMTFDKPPDFSRRGWQEVKRGAMRAAAEHWHAVMLQRHFAQSARGRYGYQPRSAKYQRRKVRAVMSGKAKSGHDLVFSGLAMESALKPPRIKAFPSRARLDLLSPPYIKMRPDRRGKRKAMPAMGDEMTRVVYEESQDLARVAIAYMELRLGDVRYAVQSVSVTTSTAMTANWAPEYVQSYTVICE